MARRRYKPLPPLVNRYSGVSDADAECVDCGWSTNERKNALATGASHARRTGHMVRASQEISVTYNRRDGAPDPKYPNG